MNGFIKITYGKSMKEQLIPQKFKQRAKELKEKMKLVSGYDAEANTRERPFVTARTMIAHVLIEEGCTFQQTGQLLGRNHSTIVHYEKNMAAYLSSPGYEAERELWERFKKEI